MHTHHTAASQAQHTYLPVGFLQHLQAVVARMLPAHERIQRALVNDCVKRSILVLGKAPAGRRGHMTACQHKVVTTVCSQALLMVLLLLLLLLQARVA